MKIYTNFFQQQWKILGGFLIVALLFSILPVNTFSVKAEEENKAISSTGNSSEILQNIIKSGENVRSFKVQPGHEISGDQFFPQQKDAFKLTENDTFQPFASQHMNGYELQRVQQYYKGVEVLGGQYILKLQNNKVIAGNGKIASKLEIDTKPKISEEKALKVVLDNLQGKTFPWETDSQNHKKPEGKLAIFSGDFSFKPESMALVYKFFVPVGAYENYLFLIDAKTGELLAKSNNLMPLNETNVTVNNLPTVFNGQQSVELVQYNDAGSAQNKHKLERLQTMTSAVLQTKCEDNGQIHDYIDEDLDGDFNDVSSNCRNKEGISVHWGIDKTLDHFHNKFGWQGIDPGGMYIIESRLTNDPSIATAGAAYEGYEPATQKAKFVYYSVPGVDEGPYVDIDTVAHESTHGVMLLSMQAQPAEYTLYCETTSLGEGIADIFGVLVDQEVTGNPNHWLMGDKDSPNAVRDLANPLAKTYGVAPFGCPIGQPAFPHVNGGVVSYWFYLLAKGGSGINGNNHSYSVTQIPKDKAEKILFKTITEKVTVGEGFADMRHDTLEAAEELYPGDLLIKRAVTDAWYAVGVGDPYEDGLYASPKDGAEGVAPWPEVQFMIEPSSSFEMLWEGEIATDEQFTSGKTFPINSMTLVGSLPVAVTPSNLDIALKPHTKYYWRVRPVQMNWEACKVYDIMIFCTNYDHVWTRTRSFTTDDRTGTVIAPTPATAQNSQALHHPWYISSQSSDVDGAVEYVRQFAIDPITFQQYEAGQPVALASGFVNETGPAQMFVDLRVEQNSYYGRMRAKGPADFLTGEDTYGEWYPDATGVFFRTTLPETELQFPANNAGDVSPWVILKGKAVKGAKDILVSLGPTGGAFASVLHASAAGELQMDFTDPSLQNLSNQWIYWSMQPNGPAPFNELGQETQPWRFKVNPELTRPKLHEPAPPPSYVNQGRKQLVFHWGKVEYAIKYKLKIWDKDTGVAIIDGEILPGGGDHEYYTGPDNDSLSSNTNGGYCWRVIAVGPNKSQGLPGESCYEISPPFPTLITPAEGDTNVNYDNTFFQWDGHNAYRYEMAVYYFDDNGITHLYQNLDTGNLTSATLTLEPDTHYLWSVTAFDQHGRSTHSDNNYFETKKYEEPQEPQPDPGKPENSPLAFTLTEPSNDDFDMIIYDPNGTEYTYNSINHYVQDSVAGSGPDIAYWENPPHGTYEIYIHVYERRNELTPHVTLAALEGGYVQDVLEDTTFPGAETDDYYGPYYYTY